MPARRVIAAASGGVLFALASVFAVSASSDADAAAAQLRLEQSSIARGAAASVGQQLDQARLSAVIVSRMPSFAAYAAADEDDASKRQKGAISSARIGALATMTDLQRALPALVGPVSLRTMTGTERARVVSGAPSGPQDLAADATALPWFSEVMTAAPGEVFQSDPYTPEGGQQVMATAVVVADFAGTPQGVLSFETPIDSLWIAARNRAGDARVVLTDAAAGVLAGEVQTLDGVVAELTPAWGADASDGVITTDEHLATFARVPADTTLPGRTELDWIVVTSGPAVADGWAAQTPLSIGLAAAAVILLLVALLSWLRSVRQVSADREVVAAERDQLAESIEQISDALGRAAHGDLSVRLPVEGLNDETLVKLAGSFDDTLAQLREVVAEAQESGHRLAGASVELRANAGQQAGAAHAQQRVVSETTATIEELAATAAQIAHTSESVASAAAETLRLTEDGRFAVSQSVTAMETIASRVDSIADRAARLGEKSSEIGRILEVIDDLADRTNLLALNAAIEAARAGEHGRGFAVVAAEVRKLAERAQQSTSQIQSIVTEIAAETAATVRASEEGAAEVHSGVRLAHEAVYSLDHIAGMVDHTTTATKEISIATQQQRSASDQVVSAMTQVSDATRQHAAGSAQAAASAEEMAEMASRLRESIAAFHTS